MFLIVPLVWCVAKEDRPIRFSENPVPAKVVIDSVPLFALDKHTRIGQQAIRKFALENTAVSRRLQAVPAKQRSGAACMAAFYTDASPVARRLAWSQSVSLEALGTEADLMGAGVTAEDIAPLLQAFRDNLGHLNEVRARLFTRARAGG
jgi:hypothetical protein